MNFNSSKIFLSAVDHKTRKDLKIRLSQKCLLWRFVNLFFGDENNLRRHPLFGF